jgi:hypothetical protein
MGDPYKGKVAGHALASGAISGAPWPLRGKWPQIAQCECGAESEMLDSIEKRRAWHRQHKGDKLDDFVANGCDDRGREVHL